MGYCYEVSSKYFNKNKENIDEIKERDMLNKLVRVNKFSTKRDMSNALSLNPGISKFRYKYVPNNVPSGDISKEEARDLVAYLKIYKSKILKMNETRR